MKLIDNLGIVIFPSPRSRAYLQSFEKMGLSPSCCLLVESPSSFDLEINNTKIDYFDLERTEEESLTSMGVNYKTVHAKSINDKKIRTILRKQNEEYFIYTGGGIVSSEVLNEKHFIHIHSGDLPKYRGSTTFYYSILNDNNIVCSVILMDPKIDEGPILHKRKFTITGGYNFDHLYEPYLRSVTLSEFIYDFIEGNLMETLKKQEEDGETYYIIHPVLKHLSILKTE